MRCVTIAGLALTLATSAWAVPSNDDCAGATVVGSLPVQYAVDTSTATLGAGEPPFVCHDSGVFSGRTVWYAFTAPHAMTIEIDTHDTGGGGVTALVAYEGTCGALTSVVCNRSDFDDYAPYGRSRIPVTLGAGETAYIQVWEDGSVGADVVVTIRESAVFRASTSSPDDVLGWPVVAAQPGGGYLVAWRESPDVMARLYDADGFPQGAPFVVSTSVPQDSRLGLDGDGSGNFVISWRGAGGVFAQRIDATGSLVGSEITVAGSSYRWTNVGVADDGDFVVAWVNGPNLMARRYDAGGAPVGSAFTVSSGGDLRYAKVGMAADGRFVVSWTDDDGDGAGVFARLYDAAGSPDGALFLVNETTTSDQGYLGGPGVSMADDGSFVIAWEDSDCPAFDCVRGRRFDATGSPLGGNFAVSENVAYDYSYSTAVAHDASGAFVVSWVSYDDGPMPGASMRPAARSAGTSR